MGVSKRAGLFLMLSVFGVSVYAQDNPAVPYVDRGAAQVRVDTLTKEVETLRADSARQNQEIAALIAKSTTVRKWVDDLAPLLAELKKRNGNLATISDAIVDRALKAKAAAAAAKNKASEKLLTKRMEELAAQLVLMANRIQALTDQVSINDARAARNTDDIIVLQATLTRTKVQEAQLQTLLDQVDGLSLRVDTALQQTVP